MYRNLSNISTRSPIRRSASGPRQKMHSVRGEEGNVQRRLDGFSLEDLGGVSSYRAERAPPNFVPCSSFCIHRSPLRPSHPRQDLVHGANAPRRRLISERCTDTGIATVAVAFASMLARFLLPFLICGTRGSVVASCSLGQGSSLMRDDPFGLWSRDEGSSWYFVSNSWFRDQGSR